MGKRVGRTLAILLAVMLLWRGGLCAREAPIRVAIAAWCTAMRMGCLRAMPENKTANW